MMPVDASIYAMMQQPKPLPGPLDQFAQGLQVRNMMDQGELQGLQRQQLQQQIQAQPAARQFQETERMAKLMEQDDKLVKSFAAQGKQELMNVTPETWAQWRATQNDRVQMLATPQYQQAAAQALRQMPEQFDPNWIKSKLASDTAAPAGHTRLPGGNLSPIDPEYLKGQTAISEARRPQVSTTTNVLPPNQTFNNEDKLRNDYTANPLVKSSSEMASAFNLIDAAYKRPSAANDLAMATKYMKILDPTSVVRESEFALAVNATGLLDKTQNYAASILEGKKLNPAQRKDFYDSAKAINDAFQAERGKVDQQYSEMATGYGLNPKNVIPSLRTKAAPKPAAAPVYAPTDAPRKAIGGKKYVNINGQWFEER